MPPDQCHELIPAFGRAGVLEEMHLVHRRITPQPVCQGRRVKPSGNGIAASADSHQDARELPGNILENGCRVILEADAAPGAVDGLGGGQRRGTGLDHGFTDIPQA